MRTCNGCKECCYTYTVPEMNKPRLEWCRHACEAGCAIHDQARPDICTDFQCYWKASNWSEDLRPDRCSAIFRWEGSIRTVYGNKRLVLLVDLRDRYAYLRRALSKHLDQLYIAGNVIGISHTPRNGDVPLLQWRFQERLYPGLTESKLLTAYREAHAAGFAAQNEFYKSLAARQVRSGDAA